MTKHLLNTFVQEDSPRALASGLSSVQTRTSYNNFLIVPACICMMCIVRYLMKNIGITIKVAILVLTKSFTDISD